MVIGAEGSGDQRMRIMLADKPSQGLSSLCGDNNPAPNLDFTKAQMLQMLDTSHPHPWVHGIYEKWDFNAFFGISVIFFSFFLLGGLKALPFSELRVCEIDLLTV